MKKNILTFLYIISLLVSVFDISYAARMYMESPSVASSNRESFVITIFLDPDHATISGLSGDFSFPTDLFDVKTISTQNGLVPLWAVQPQVSKEKYFDQRTHIIFEGIVPGGFDGVRTVYDTRLHAGIVFTVILTPKNKGQGELSLTDIELHAFDSNATYIPSKEDRKMIIVPPLSGGEIIQDMSLRLGTSKTIMFDILKNDLVNNGAPYVYVHDTNPSRTIAYIEIAETDEYDPVHVSKRYWHRVDNPYSLIYTSQTKYIHAKIVYTDNTYVFKTIAPVENSHSIVTISRILVYIVVSISLIYFYGKKLFESRKKNSKK